MTHFHTSSDFDFLEEFQELGRKAEDVVERLTKYRDMAKEAAAKQAGLQDVGYFQGKADALDIAIAAVLAIIPAKRF